MSEKGEIVAGGGGDDGSGGGSGSAGAGAAGLLSDPQPGNKDIPTIRTRSSGIKRDQPGKGVITWRLFSNFASLQFLILAKRSWTHHVRSKVNTIPSE